ncbi:MAG: TonB family protein, partial [Sphingobacteriaceae bacterium]|nr:TonB family protein [Cytophagaceae bacterium]
GRHLAGRDTILIHERVHARQLHSADVLLVELLAIFNWFNPAVYTYRQSLRAVHEFIADQHASRHAHTKADYALLLFAKQFGVSPQLTNSFFSQSLLRRRVAMLQKAHSPRRALLKYGLTAPLFGAMLVFSSAAVSDSRALEAVERVVQSEQPLRAAPVPVSESDATEAGFPNLAKAVALSLELQREMRGDTVGPVFTAVENPAEFPGGPDALGMFLMRNLRYPKEAQVARVTGKVFVQFIVEKNGTVTNAQVMKDVGYGTGEEALRVVRLMPAWKPGRQRGKAVRSRFIVPLTFAFEDHPFSTEPNLKTAAGAVLREIVVLGYAPHSARPERIDSTQTGLRIRGIYTGLKLKGMNLTKEPLCFMDGKEIDADELEKLDPDLIESLQVLKNSSAAVEYGERGKNGVILITTKKK